MNDKVRTINIDGIEVQTSLTPLELADLPQKYAELQSNWNSLRELLINEKKLIEEDEFFCNLSNKDYIEFILDKMNELEGKDKNEF